MSKRVVVGTYGLEQEVNLDQEKNEIVQINSLKQFIKAGWLNNLDVFVVNCKALEKAIVYRLNEALDQIDICVIALGNEIDLPAATYRLAYENIDDKVISDGILDFVVNNLWNYKNSKIFSDEEIVISEMGETTEAEVFRVLQGLVNYIDHKDAYTKNHCERVAQYASLIADAAQMSEVEKDLLIKAALVHDVGKIGISHEILMKKERLDDNEYSMMQQHSQIADNLLSNRYFTKLKPIIRAHHERYDGRGYPDNLKGEEIPFEARILAIADAFDAMITQRGYNNPRSFEEAIAQLEKNSGRQFDPSLVPLFVETLQKENHNLGDEQVEPDQVEQIFELGKAM